VSRPRRIEERAAAKSDPWRERLAGHDRSVAVREDMIERRPDAVQLLVDGVARNQNPALLRWAFTNPINRVMYNPSLRGNRISTSCAIS
jgi:hypothetical protein